ncbi:hypothetical protein BHM03_00028216 [Ensete ventricosum]|nr:hypothetical protein BHM03_00028216 [Ensete ventricosum]
MSTAAVHCVAPLVGANKPKAAASARPAGVLCNLNNSSGSNKKNASSVPSPSFPRLIRNSPVFATPTTAAPATVRSLLCSLFLYFICLSESVMEVSVERVKSGFADFKKEVYEKKTDLFADLKEGQSPKFMVFACADSRVCPSVVLNFQPGEAFTIRNIANMVPPYDQVLYLPTHTSAVISSLPLYDDVLHRFLREAVNVSLHNLKTYPFVKEAVEKKSLKLIGAHYDFVNGVFETWEA